MASLGELCFRLRLHENQPTASNINLANGSKPLLKLLLDSLILLADSHKIARPIMVSANLILEFLKASGLHQALDVFRSIANLTQYLNILQRLTPDLATIEGSSTRANKAEKQSRA